MLPGMQRARRRSRSIHSPTAPPQSGSSSHELAAQIHLSICRHWTATLCNPHDWGEHPLGAYVLTEEFLESISNRTQRTLRRATEVCAMLACDRVQAQRALGVRPRSDDRADRQLVRADGATGWECPLDHPCDHVCLRYWIHTDGTVEFGALVGPRTPPTCARKGLRPRQLKRRL